MTREFLTSRRRSWTQKVRIDGQSFYLTCGEYPDGRLGEIWIEAHQEGTFSRGILQALARTISIALQCGASVQDVAHALRELNFPPNGVVAGDQKPGTLVKTCTSVPDWIAQELEMAYLGIAPRGVVPSVSLITELGGTDDLGRRSPVHQTRTKYTGETCDGCGSSRLVRTGKCHTCQDCGETGGCS